MYIPNSMNYTFPQKNILSKTTLSVGVLLVLFFPFIPVVAKITVPQKLKERVIFGTVSTLDTYSTFFILDTSTSTRMGVVYSSTTEFYTGYQESVSLADLQPGMRIYVFGLQPHASTTYNDTVIPLMQVDKIIIRNKSKLIRKPEIAQVAPVIVAR